MTVPLPALGAAVEGLTAINCALLVALRGGVPRLYESNVVYREPGKVQWHNIADLFDLGYGDCKDLAAARCAELRYFESEAARPLIYFTRETPNGNHYHAIVVRADGSEEDPSAILLELERERGQHR